MKRNIFLVGRVTEKYVSRSFIILWSFSRTLRSSFTFIAHLLCVATMLEAADQNPDTDKLTKVGKRGFQEMMKM